MNSAAENRTCPGCGAAIPANAPQGICPKCLMAAAATTDAGQTRGKRPEPPSLERLAAAFPQLELIEFIGQGGMGAVYKARQKQLDRIVALKVLPPGIGGDAAFAERFTREAKALAKLLHPNIVALFEFGQADGIYYLLMEYVDGVNLGQLLRASRVSPREALAIVPQICDALQYAHDQGIVHRDVKPENILLDRRGRVKVADFGLAKLVEANAPLTPSLSPSDGERVAGRPDEGKTPALTDAGKIMGTPAYMAPEQAEHPADVDHRADIYALGVVFYQMLTGELPGKAIEPPSKKVQIDVRLDEVVLRALEKKPELRYQQVSEVKTAVETIATTGSVAASVAPVGVAPGATTQNKSGLVRLFETLSGSAFTSPLAIKLINVSALGFLGFLGSLGFLGYGPPGWHWCFGFFGFSGFFGFFGLIGAALIVEAFSRSKGGSSSATQCRFVVVGRRGGKAVVNWPGVLLGFVIALAFGETFTAVASLVVVNRIVALPLFTVFCSVLAGIAAIVISKKLVTPLDKLVPLDAPPAAVAPPSNVTPPSETAPGHSKPWVSFCVTLAYSGAVFGLGANLSLGPVFGIFVVLICLTLLLALLLSQSATPQAWRTWFKLVAWLGSVASLLIIGYAVEALYAAMYRSPWGAHLDQTVLYSIIWLGAIALPIWTVRLWRAVRKPARPAAPRSRLRAALIVGVLVWLFVAGTVTVITWIRAESWKVVAVISCPRKSQPGHQITDLYFKHAATMIELIRSDVILGRVTDRLELDERSGKLDKRWGKRDLSWLKLPKTQAMVLLRRRLDVRSSEGGTLIQLGVHGKRPEKWEEAMDIADAIAKELRAFRIEQHDPPTDMLEMTARATPPDILLGLAAGLVPGLLAGGLTALYLALRKRRLVANPGVPPAEPASKNSTGKVIAIGCAVLVLGGLVVLALLLAMVFAWRAQVVKTRSGAMAAAEAQMAEAKARAQQLRASARANQIFGPVTERVIEARQSGTNMFLDLDTGRLTTPPAEVVDALTNGNSPHDIDRYWQGRDILDDTRPSRYVAWLREDGIDLMFNGNGEVLAFDGVWAVAHGTNSLNWDSWNGLTPEMTRIALKVVEDASRNSASGVTIGSTVNGESYTSAERLHSRYGSLAVNELTQEQSLMWFFKTREGGMGILQITGLTDNRRGVKIRYKLVLPERDEGK